MQHFELKGQVREVSNKAAIKSLRRQGYVPCNLYGKGVDNILFTVSEKELKGLTHTPAAYIVDINLDNGQKYMAVMHELQFHPINDLCLHADFLAINESQPVTMNIPIKITGHAAGVKAGGKFILRKRNLKVSGLMENLPDELKVDITKLRIGKHIVAGDLKYNNINIVTPKATIICAVKATRQMAAGADDEEEEEENSEEGEGTTTE